MQCFESQESLELRKGRFRQHGAEGGGFSFYRNGVAMFKDMKAYAHLKPGQNGPKRLAERYGKALLCVRYRYDSARGIKLKTVEIVVEERPASLPLFFRDDDLVPVAVAFEETVLRERLRKIRAKWDPTAKLWMAPYRLIRRTELEARIQRGYRDGIRKS